MPFPFLSVSTRRPPVFDQKSLSLADYSTIQGILTSISCIIPPFLSCALLDELSKALEQHPEKLLSAPQKLFADVVVIGQTSVRIGFFTWEAQRLTKKAATLDSHKYIDYYIDKYINNTEVMKCLD